MTNTWATHGVDLHLEPATTRVRARLEDQLRAAVRRGALQPGTRLPSSRSMAVDLGVARNTVADAYGQLVAEGWFSTRHGAGTWVSPTAAGSIAALVERSPHPRDERAEERPQPFDLRPGVPDVSSFPRAAWLAAARRALAQAPDDALGYGPAAGVMALRSALAAYLGRARGVITDPQRIIVCSGFTQGLELLVEVLRERGGASFALEGMGHQLHRRIIERQGFNTVRLDVDDGGAVTEELGEASALLLTPAHQFPRGVPLSSPRRREAIDWAAGGGLVVEDDYDGEFRYDRQAVGAMQALDPERVVYAGTASKTLAPGVRLAWLAAPAALAGELIDAKAAAGRSTSVLDQLALAELIACGAYDRHVRRARLAYRRRREHLVAELARTAPAARVRGVAAGLHLLVELPAGDEADIVARAAERGLALQGLGTFCAPGISAPPALVIGYATPPDHAYTAAVARLGAVLAT